LQAISGISELMMKSPPQDDQLFEKLRLISEQVEKMGNITRKLMRIMKYTTKAEIGILKALTFIYKCR
jgi:hypothetical protein